MKRLGIPLGLCVFIKGLVWISPSQAETPAVRRVQFEAPSVACEMAFNIILPVDYESSEKTYPVLYLLHGRQGNEDYWVELRVPEYAAGYDLIVVIPDAGPSWFVNWVESYEGQKNNWEDYVTKDLIGYVDTHFRTIASREGRAIGGKSMGGYGALMLSFRNPELFCSTSSIAGGLRFIDKLRAHLRGESADPLFLTGPVPKGKMELAAATPRGLMVATLENCDAIDPYKLVLKVPRERLPDIRIDCGLDDNLLEASQRLAKALMEEKIRFTFEQAPGAHTPEYGSYAVKYTMAYQYTVMRTQLAAKGEG